MKKILFRILSVLWIFMALIIFICSIIPSPIIWIITGKSYLDNLDDFLTEIADKLYQKGK